MNVAMIGSVSSSWYTLDALIRGRVEITCVLGVDESRADAISDYRSLRDLAGDAAIPFRPFVKITESAVEATLRRHPPDLLFVIGLSQLVPDVLIALARHGGVGFHPTMLPEGRGRAPVAWTILLGARAAANLFYLTDEPDAGDIIVQREVPVLADDYSDTLIQRTNEVLAGAIIELAPRIQSGELPRHRQDHSNATYYAKRTPADGLIDWTKTADETYRLVRAASRPYPGAFTYIEGRKLTVWRGSPTGASGVGTDSDPGVVVQIDPEGHPIVATRDGGFRLTEIEWEPGGKVAEKLEQGSRLA